ncbi:hypothetical protein [Haploplasma modicum]|uniref:hypothetical protein n=1 Tax=Haploplasma modicum TaxID=2150 RepID=UPI00214B8EC4|nr:hypothetical protein [Haploplasma modicum]MCR1809119.1 hypothetical protein [Haploplasma modicum]
MKKQRNDLYIEKMGLYLNKRFEIHILIAIILFKSPLIIYDKVSGLIIYSVIATIFIEAIKLFIVRYFFEILSKTKGLIFILINGVCIYLSTLFNVNITFKKPYLLSLLLFVIIFSFVKLLFVIVFQKIQFVKDKENEDV